jgi:hypothetical protein
VLLFVGGGAYGQWRMAQVTQDLASLARELGYTPDTHLHHEITARDVNIVSGSAFCEANLYYITSLNLADFTARLNELEPETKDLRRDDILFDLSGVIPGLRVHDANSHIATSTSQNDPMMLYRWTLLNKSYKTYITFYDTTNLHALMKHEGQKVRGNIIRLSMEGGIFQIWIDCPAKFRDAPDDPFD